MKRVGDIITEAGRAAGMRGWNQKGPSGFPSTHFLIVVKVVA